MNRFSRLVSLRRLREEEYGMAYARMLAKIEGLQQSVVALDEVTKEESSLARASFGKDSVVPSKLVEDFLKGQAWRRKKLQWMIANTRPDVEKAKAVWLSARVELKQAEKLAEKEMQKQRQEVEKRERKTMDMIGLIRNRPFSEQEGVF